MLRSRWLEDKAPALNEYCARANRLAFWFAYLLIHQAKLKTRTKTLEHFIKIGMYLSKLHNYQSLMALFLGINMVSARLTPIWKSQILRPKTLSTWKRISTLMSPNDNFSHYREATKKIETPFIPCQEVILKDLLYHDQSTKDFIQERVWNYKKLQVIGKIIEQYRLCQDNPFNLTPLSELQYLLLHIPEITSSQLDSVPEELDSPPSFTSKINLPPPVQRAEKTEATTESDNTDDADSSVGNTTATVVNSVNNLARSASARRRSGSINEDMPPITIRFIKSREGSKISVLDPGRRRSRQFTFFDEEFMAFTERKSNTEPKSDDIKSKKT